MTELKWWETAVIYQIYPRSFQDSNSDGIDDLPGMTTRLEYIANLGVDAIWISPFYPSPQKDFADAAAGLAVLVQDAPDRVRQEWDLFQEEVKAEAERLDRGGDVDTQASPASSVEEESLQTKIDQLRARVSALGIRMEERS